MMIVINGENLLCCLSSYFSLCPMNFKMYRIIIYSQMENKRNIIKVDPLLAEVILRDLDDRFVLDPQASKAITAVFEELILQAIEEEEDEKREDGGGRDTPSEHSPPDK